MTEPTPTSNSITSFIANHWVSWLIEFTIMGTIAWYTISETRQTAQETRDMLHRFEAAIAQFGSNAAEKTNAAAAESYQAIKDKAGSISAEDLTNMIKALREPTPPPLPDPICSQCRARAKLRASVCGD